MVAQIPDLVIIVRTDKPAKLVLMELTVHWDQSKYLGIHRSGRAG